MLKGLICPAHTETEGQCVAWESCLKRRCQNCMPYPMRQAIYDSISERDRWVSPSTLTGCLRKAKWQLTKDYYLPPVQAYWFMRGSFIHEILETATRHDKGLKEYPVSRKVEGTNLELRGQIDYYIDGTLYDYKTMTDMGFNFFKKNGKPKDPHVEQTNYYRWMMMPEHDVNDIKIVYMGMGVWCVTGEIMEFDKWGRKEVYDMAPCPLWTPEKTFDKLKTKVDIIERMDNPPADSSAKWLCQICPFEEQCHNISKGESMSTKEPF